MNIDRQTQMMLAEMGDGAYLASDVARMAKLSLATTVQCLLIAEKAGYVERCGTMRPPGRRSRRQIALWHKLVDVNELPCVHQDGFTTNDDLDWMNYWRQPRKVRMRLEAEALDRRMRCR